MADSISNLFNRIKNAQAVSHPTVEVPFSKFLYNFSKILEKEGFVKKVKKRGRKANKVVRITLKYENDKPAISEIKRISKPSQRLYSKAKDLRKIKGGHGISVISTSQGLMTGKEAKKKNLGGEIICKIW